MIISGRVNHEKDKYSSKTPQLNVNSRGLLYFRFHPVRTGKWFVSLFLQNLVWIQTMNKSVAVRVIRLVSVLAAHCSQGKHLQISLKIIFDQIFADKRNETGIRSWKSSYAISGQFSHQNEEGILTLKISNMKFVVLVYSGSLQIKLKRLTITCFRDPIKSE